MVILTMPFIFSHSQKAEVLILLILFKLNGFFGDELKMNLFTSIKRRNF
jgi:hypothetical protein